MNDERRFWIEVRRGFRTTIAAIDHEQPTPVSFWQEIRKGLTITARAIEYRYHLPIGSRSPLGQTPLDEPPAEPLAQSSREGIE